VCPLSFDIFVDPVTAADGYTYERSLIEDFWAKKGCCISPFTNEKLENSFLARAQGIREAVEDYHLRQKRYKERREKWERRREKKEKRREKKHRQREQVREQRV